VENQCASKTYPTPLYGAQQGAARSVSSTSARPGTTNTSTIVLHETCFIALYMSQKSPKAGNCEEFKLEEFKLDFTKFVFE
jgi:hypothetical protein